MSTYVGGQGGTSLPLSTSFGGADGEAMAGKTIAATAGLPTFQMGCAAGPGISAYENPHFGYTSGGGGTAAGAQFKANNTDGLDGDGN
jgi:hypothetical protein